MSMTLKNIPIILDEYEKSRILLYDDPLVFILRPYSLIINRKTGLDSVDGTCDALNLLRSVILKDEELGVNLSPGHSEVLGLEDLKDIQDECLIYRIRSEISKSILKSYLYDYIDHIKNNWKHVYGKHWDSEHKSILLMECNIIDS